MDWGDTCKQDLVREEQAKHRTVRVTVLIDTNLREGGVILFGF
jgi:hypothetical protein